MQFLLQYYSLILHFISSLHEFGSVVNILIIALYQLFLSSALACIFIFCVNHTPHHPTHPLGIFVDTKWDVWAKLVSLYRVYGPLGRSYCYKKNNNLFGRTSISILIVAIQSLTHVFGGDIPQL